jgi:acetyl esterase/lipase
MNRTAKLAAILAWLTASATSPVFAESAHTVDIHQKWLDIRYASSSSAQMLDIYLPNDGQGPFPVILQIHGGAFMEGDKQDGQLSPVLSALARGYAVVAVNYRLSGEAHFPAAIQDVKAALRWVRANAASYKLDAARMAAWGDSAGAALAVLAAVSANVPSLSDGSLGNPGMPDTVQAAIGWYGPYEFTSMDAQFLASGSGAAMHGGPGSAESRFLGATVSQSSDLAAKVNPATYLTPDDPPMLLQAGTRDPIVPVEQTKNFSQTAARVLGPKKVTLRLLEGAGHGGPAFESAENLRFILDWLDRVLK